MKIFTGSYKKSIAGIACVLSVFFMSASVYANTADAASAKSIAAPNSSVNAVENSVVGEDKDLSAQTPVAVNSTAGTQQSAPPQPAASQAVTSQSTKSTALPKTTSSASQLASLIGGLVLILALIYGLSWFVKRFSQGGFMQNPSMKIVSAMPLGTRERLMLVDVGGKHLLLGVTATQINTLHVFDEPIDIAEKSQPIASDFSQKLMAILQQKNVASSIDAAQKNSNS